MIFVPEYEQAGGRKRRYSRADVMGRLVANDGAILKAPKAWKPKSMQQEPNPFSGNPNYWQQCVNPMGAWWDSSEGPRNRLVAPNPATTFMGNRQSNDEAPHPSSAIQSPAVVQQVQTAPATRVPLVVSPGKNWRIRTWRRANSAPLYDVDHYPQPAPAEQVLPCRKAPTGAPEVSLSRERQSFFHMTEPQVRRAKAATPVPSKLEQHSATRLLQPPSRGIPAPQQFQIPLPGHDKLERCEHYYLHNKRDNHYFAKKRRSEAGQTGHSLSPFTLRSNWADIYSSGDSSQL